MRTHLAALIVAAPPIAAGLWLWRGQGAMIVLGDFVTFCLG